MKNKVYLPFLLLLLLGISTLQLSAQNIPVLEQKITISFNNESTEGALNKISQQQGVKFSYPSGIISDQNKINRSFNNTRLREVLSQLLGPGINIKNKGNYIILTGKKIQENKITVKARAFLNIFFCLNILKTLRTVDIG